jgi:hypothetical protein
LHKSASSTGADETRVLSVAGANQNRAANVTRNDSGDLLNEPACTSGTTRIVISRAACTSEQVQCPVDEAGVDRRIRDLSAESSIAGPVSTTAGAPGDTQGAANTSRNGEMNIGGRSARATISLSIASLSAGTAVCLQTAADGSYCCIDIGYCGARPTASGLCASGASASIESH